MMKKAIVVILSFAMIFSSFIWLDSSKAYAADKATAKITVECQTAEPGGAAVVKLDISNNPGILGATLSISYDKRLSLVSAENGEAWDEGAGLVLTKPGKYASPCKFVWDGIELKSVKNGTILVLTFETPNDAEAGTKYEIEASYQYGDITDSNLDNVKVDIVNGYVEVADYNPGDVNNDGEINAKDVIMARRSIAGGYDQDIKIKAIDVNGDNLYNSKDIILIRRYIAGGWGVDFVRPTHKSDEDCEHSLVKVARVEAKCEEVGNIEYWECSKCGKVYADEEGTTLLDKADTVIDPLGHTPVTDPAVEPTTTTTGLTEGSHCGVCKKVLVVQKEVPVIEENEYTLQYNIANGDTYLASLSIDNPNSSGYNSEDGLELLDLDVDGYRFKGWYDGATSDANKITEIAKNSTGNKKLYAHWEKIEYTVQFDSNVCPIDSKTYTVDKGLTLENPTWYGYTFVCWTDEHGNVVSRINKGTTGNITLFANWTSKRNQTRPVAYSDQPLVVEEDLDKGVYSFVYKIGTIENVPLNVIHTFPNALKGINYSETVTTSTAVSDSQAESIADTVANVTTRTDAWTYSKELSQELEISKTHSEEVSEEQIEKASQSFSQAGTWSCSTGRGSSSTITNENGITSRIYNENSSTLGIGIGGEIGGGKNASLSVPLEGGSELGVGNNSSWKLTGNINYSNTKTSGSETIKTEKTTNTLENYFNINRGYEKSFSMSQNQEYQYKIGTTICNTTGQKNTIGEKQSESNTQSTASSSSNSRESASSFTYGTTNIEESQKQISFTNAQEGYYRLVTAGTLDVFAVVTFDAESRTVSTSTYSILEDKTDVFFDYSAETANFNDHENGVLPFEIPKYVADYVGTVCGSDNFTIDADTGIITDYYGDETALIVPEFISIDTADGKQKAIKVLGFDSDAFAGKNIEAIELNRFITEIPNEAFKDCDKLEYISCPNVTKIGDGAFAGCKNLENFIISTQITSVGDNAFTDIKKLTCYANNSEIAKFALTSGAKDIALYLEYMSDELKDYVIDIPDTADKFALYADGKTLHGVSVKSGAKETILNNVKLEDCIGIPLSVTSDTLSLNRVTIEAEGLATIMRADTTNLKLYGTNNITSKEGEDAILARNISVSQADPKVAAKANIYGNVVVCGDVINTKYLSITNGTIIKISEEEFNRRLQSSTITFNPNGGAVSPGSIQVAFGEKYGNLPEPTRKGFEFAGWFTSKEGGKEVTKETLNSGGGDVTLYAHWNSEWIKASELPDGAEIVDSKYTYTLTSYTTSSKNSLEGWEYVKKTESYSAWSAWSGWQNSSVASSDLKDVEKRTIAATYRTLYNYSRWRNTSTGNCGPVQGTWGGVYCGTYEERGWQTGQLAFKQWHYNTSQAGTFAEYGQGWFNEQTTQQVVTAAYDQWRYRTRTIINTYHFKKCEEKEIDDIANVSIPSGAEISNETRWVKYKG